MSKFNTLRDRLAGHARDAQVGIGENVGIAASRARALVADAVRIGSEAGTEARRRVMESTAIVTNAALATEMARALDRWMRDAFSSSATAYDKAMDAVHIRVHLGGDHRLFDGGHDLVGAWEAVRNALPKDAFDQEVAAYFGALWKDVVTPKGLPVATFDHDSFMQASAWLADNLGVAKGWLADAACYTATELGGAVIGALAVALQWTKPEIERFASLASSLGITSAASANPALVVVSLVTLAYAFEQARREGRSGFAAVADGVARGGIGTGILVALSALIPGPGWVGLMIGIIGSMLAQRAYAKGKAALPADRRKEIVAYLLAQFGRRTEASDPTGGLISTAR